MNSTQVFLSEVSCQNCWGRDNVCILYSVICSWSLYLATLSVGGMIGRIMIEYTGRCLVLFVVGPLSQHISGKTEESARHSS